MDLPEIAKSNLCFWAVAKLAEHDDPHIPARLGFRENWKRRISSSWNPVKLSGYVFHGDFPNVIAHQTVDPRFGRRLVGGMVFNKVQHDG